MTYWFIKFWDWDRIGKKMKDKEVKIIFFSPKLHSRQTLEIFQSRPDIFPDRELKIITEGLKKASGPSHLKLVAVVNNKVVGYIGAFKAEESQDSWELDWFTVDENFQRKGIGSLLMKAIERRAKEKNTARLFIETCSCKGELPARKFYQKQGYKRIAVLPNFYSKNHSKVIFFKQFSQEVKNKKS